MESNSSPKLSTPEKTESAADTEAIADEMAASLSSLSIDPQPISPGGNPHPFCPARNISRNNDNPHHHYHHRPNPNRNPNFNYMRSPNPSFMNRPTSHHNQCYYPRGKYSNPYNQYNNPTVIQNSGPQFHNTTTIYHNNANPSSSIGQFWLPPPPPPHLPLDFSAPFMYGFPIYGGEAEGFSVPRRPNAFIRSPTHNFAGPQWLYQHPLPPPIVPNETPLLLAEIRKQIEYYFSNNNLCSDLHLRGHMDSEGWVDIRLIAGFNLIVAKTNSLDVIREALRLSESVELQDDRMRKRHGWSEWIWPSRKQETKMTLSKAPSAETR